MTLTFILYIKYYYHSNKYSKGYDNIKNEIESIEKDNWEIFSKTLNSYYNELSKTIKKYNGDIGK